MNAPTPLIAVTLGDPAGIGPEIVGQAIADPRVRDTCRTIAIGHPELLRRATENSQTVGDISLVPWESRPHNRQELLHWLSDLPKQSCPIINPTSADVLTAPAGAVSAVAGEAAYQCLQTAIDLSLAGTVDGIATAPLNKEALHRAGHHFPGHTEILADRCAVDDFSMMLHLPESRLQPLRQLVAADSAAPPPEGHGLSIAHVTLHTSVASVPRLLTTDAVLANVKLMNQFLQQLGSSRRSIAVAALNPHGGEHGLFGDEEARIITPAVELARQTGLNVAGPLPVDTLIRRAVSGEFDGVVAMYHDQGHIPIKLIGFDSAINITLGLPIVRTSPTHGTAFDRAWNPATPADPSGMIEAILTAVQLAQNGTAV